MKTNLRNFLEIRAIETPDWNSDSANALRTHVSEGRTEYQGRKYTGCIPCKKASTSINVVYINSSRVTETVVRTIREVTQNSNIRKKGTLFLEWSRGVLIKRLKLEKGFEFKVEAADYVAESESYGDIRGAKVWATRLILTGSFFWDKSK